MFGVKTMTLNEKVSGIIAALKKLYPQAECALLYAEPYQLLFATRLAAQCTDARVNIITKDLYKKYPSLQAFADADLSELEQAVKPCGFYHLKARDIKACAKVLLEKHNGVIPDTMEALTALPGVGRKTASLILGDIYHKPAIVADTHCIRLSNKLGLAHSKDPKKVEFELREIIPPEEQCMLCHRFVWHGRAVCNARSPKCSECTLSPYCTTYQTKAAE